MNAYNIYHIDWLIKEASNDTKEIEKGKWVPCRPLRYSSFWNRLKCAWLVLTDKVDCVRWEKQ